ncbi:hypothetical protein [Blastococcus sp. TF02A-35]|uniref:hypothetical protein n=1 Tax=Blastococcus sp. TF02A-35 TaxID=2559612 RepID=UPI001073D7E7|nr:hypothetical protein [Blastococcus sp. TF02A_35]TFV52335.1 hypothetical protein E4P43_06435 [Blastococcus sp. TF02A_35]
MITMNRTATSADVLSRGGFEPVNGSAAPSGATGLSLAPCTGWALTAAALRAPATRVPAIAGVLGKRREQALVERFLAPTHTPTDDSTPLGIHSPGRPQS